MGARRARDVIGGLYYMPTVRADVFVCSATGEDADAYRPPMTAGPLLAVLDGTEVYTDVLTLASTNDPSALDDEDFGSRHAPRTRLTLGRYSYAPKKTAPTALRDKTVFNS